MHNHFIQHARSQKTRTRRSQNFPPVGRDDTDPKTEIGHPRQSEPIPPLFAGCLPVRIIVIAAGLWADNDTFTSRRANDINASISFHFFFLQNFFQSCAFFRHFFPGTDHVGHEGGTIIAINGTRYLCWTEFACVFNRGVCESARIFFSISPSAYPAAGNLFYLLALSYRQWLFPIFIGSVSRALFMNVSGSGLINWLPSLVRMYVGFLFFFYFALYACIYK